MDTPVSRGNPFGFDRYGFLWEVLRASPAGRHLDYGAFDGRVISELMRTAVVRESAGYDVNRAVVEANQKGLLTGAHLTAVKANERLPASDGEFDSASLLDVIEHVPDPSFVLAEVRRVLRDHGTLVVTVPKRHAFSFLDMGNFKFRWPRLHRWYDEWRFGREHYERRYAASPDGLIGDISAERAWHTHYSEAEVRRMLAPHGFRVVRFDGSGLFGRPLSILRYFSPRPVRQLLAPLLSLDARLFKCTNLFCHAEKTRNP